MKKKKKKIFWMRVRAGAGDTSISVSVPARQLGKVCRDICRELEKKKPALRRVFKAFCVSPG